MKQTAVDYLQDEILHDRMIKAKSIKEWNDVIIKAKEMEKQQIIDAFYQCGRDNFEHIKVINRSATDYFNETYGSKDIALQNQLESKVITELSDEEIEKILFHHSNEYAYGFKDAIKWYREQLKQRQ